MTDQHARIDAHRNRCTNAALALRSCLDHFIERVALDESHEDGKATTLDVWLREGPSTPDVVISLAGLRSVRPWQPAPAPSCINGISLTHLPELPLPWPAEAVGRLDRTEDLPALVRLRIVGPLEIDAVASIVTVYRAPSDDAASALR
ncbi:hypothetical protein [Kitasatospora sp. CB02891]|uniref:hypothetical protein n=1 Tax=Kitasatospora sp. CB02891 TaxID=2020329 RepID=UPI000C274730|nr:hypothetical protein [Kitasatospora sp. CB02891]PJN22961.1 hypothetical protein CG736_24605 [Kitasatospora sp. CB02891]